MNKGGLAQEDPDAILDPRTLAIAYRQTESIAQSGKLTPENLIRMVGNEVTPLAIAGIARLAGVEVGAVVEVIRAASAKGMLAVAWAGDFTAEDAVQLQVKVARVPPDTVIHPRAGGGFDATEDELEWQLDMYADIARNRSTKPS